MKESEIFKELKNLKWKKALKFISNLSLEAGVVPCEWKMANLDRHSLLFKYQFGFRPSGSRELAVTYFTDLIIKEADSGKA